MLQLNEALVILTILLVQGIRNLFNPPSWLGPYLVFIVAWFMSYASSVGVMGWGTDTIRFALSQSLPITATAIVIYDAGVKPIQRLANKSAQRLGR